MYLSVSMQRELSLNFHRNNVYGNLEQKFNDSAALKLKDTFASRFASIHSVLDSVEFLEYSEVILAKFSSFCVYMLSLS